MRYRKRLVHQEVKVVASLLIDRHCRSHNIAAECCVGSRSKGLGFEISLSKAGRDAGRRGELGASCLMSNG